jgi:hypothetical protein
MIPRLRLVLPGFRRNTCQQINLKPHHSQHLTPNFRRFAEMIYRRMNPGRARIATRRTRTGIKAADFFGIHSLKSLRAICEFALECFVGKFKGLFAETVSK